MPQQGTAQIGERVGNRGSVSGGRTARRTAQALDGWGGSKLLLKMASMTVRTGSWAKESMTMRTRRLGLGLAAGQLSSTRAGAGCLPTTSRWAGCLRLWSLMSRMLGLRTRPLSLETHRRRERRRCRRGHGRKRSTWQRGSRRLGQSYRCVEALRGHQGEHRRRDLRGGARQGRLACGMAWGG